MTCRICYSDEGTLISVCACSGTSAVVHEECIRKWIRISRRTECEICLAPYTINLESAVNMSDFIVTFLGIAASGWHPILIYNQVYFFEDDTLGVVLITTFFLFSQAILWGCFHRDRIYEVGSVAIWSCTYIVCAAAAYRPSINANAVLCSWLVSGTLYISMGLISYSSVYD